MPVKIIKILKKKEELNKIIIQLNKINFDNLKKTTHFEFSVLEKLTNLEKIKQTFSRFNLIKTIEIRKNKDKIYYSLNYELEDKTYIIIAISLEDNLLINAFHVNRSYKQFEKSLKRNYKNKFIE